MYYRSTDSNNDLETSSGQSEGSNQSMDASSGKSKTHPARSRTKSENDDLDSHGSDHSSGLSDVPEPDTDFHFNEEDDTNEQSSLAHLMEQLEEFTSPDNEMELYNIRTCLSHCLH